MERQEYGYIQEKKRRLGMPQSNDLLNSNGDTLVFVFNDFKNENDGKLFFL